MSKYLEFIEHENPTAKTVIVLVKSKSQSALLGIIKWFGRWRQYAFFPQMDTTWNPECLDDVNTKIRTLMMRKKFDEQNAR